MHITKAIDDHLEVIQRVHALVPQVRVLAERMIEVLQQGGTIFWMGNGGSASDAQHLAAELIGRFHRERKALASIALNTDTSVLTCVANDYAYSHVFARQLEALCKPNDMVVGLSTSGNSPNVLAGMDTAREKRAITVGFTGQSGGELRSRVDYIIQVPSTVTARIQETHILIGHILCECIDRECGN